MKRTTLVLAIAASLAAFGCSKEEAPPAKGEASAVDVRKEATEAAGTAAAYVEQEKDQFIRDAQQELDRMEDRIASLNSRAKTATAETKAKLDAQVADLQAQWLVLEARLADLRKATAENWQEAKASFDEQMQQLKQSLDSDHEPRKQG
jgi:TolA-binding protein